MAFDVGSVVAHIKADLTNFESGISSAKSQVSGLKGHVEDFGTSLSGLMRTAAVVGTAVSGAFILIGKSALDSASQFEQSRIAFETMLGSADKAKRLLRDISDFAMKTPFELPQLVDGAKRLLAYNIEAKEIIPTMKALGNIAAGVGMDKLPNLILAFGQVKAATHLTGMELRQFTETGVPMLGALSKQLGKTEAEIIPMISSGEISFDMVDKALKSMTESGGKFFNLMERQSHTFGGVVSNIKDQIGRLLRSAIGISEEGDIRQGSIFEKLSEGANKLLGFLTLATPIVIDFVTNAIGQLTVWFNKLVEVLKPLGEWVVANQELVLGFLKGMGIALGALLIIGTIVALINLLFNPITLIVLAVGFLFAAWQTNFWGIRDITTAVINGMIDLFNNYLAPAISAIVAWFVANWIYLSEMLQGIWNIIVGIFQVAWAIIYGVISVGLALMTGDWDKAWKAIVDLINNAWAGIKNIFNGMISFISGWGGTLLRELVKPFEDAWNKIKDLVNKIKDALDFTKRHSPSVVDIVTRGVSLVNRALSDLDYGINVTPHAVAAVGVGNGKSAYNNVTVNLDGALIGNEYSALAIGEKVGDAIIRKLQLNLKI